jgi:hypothetical protein
VCCVCVCASSDKNGGGGSTADSRESREGSFLGVLCSEVYFWRGITMEEQVDYIR